MNTAASQFLDLTLWQVNSRLKKESVPHQENLDALFALIAESMPVMVWAVAANSGEAYYNRRWLEFTGRDLAQEIESGWESHIHPADAGLYRTIYQSALTNKTRFSTEYRYRRHDGEYCWMLNHAAPNFDADGEFLGYLGCCVDITAYKQQFEKLWLSAHVMEESTSCILILNDKKAIIQANKAFYNTTGFSQQEIVGRNSRRILSRKHSRDFVMAIWETAVQEGEWHGEVWGKIKNNEERPVSLSLKALKDENGQVTHFAAMFIDISERKETEQRLHFLAYHDTLTGLPNRSMFNEKLARAIAMANINKQKTSLLFIDLDRFKLINDSLGHDSGDALLREVARRLRQGLRGQDTLVRLGGDEFIVILEEITGNNQAITVAQKILSILASPFSIQGHELSISCSIGISIYPQDGSDIQTLLRNADAAMRTAKEHGRNNFQFYTADLNENSFLMLEMETYLRRALENNEMQLYYQPQMSLETGRLVGMEALLRWIHPKYGMVSPTQFIPIAEEAGLIESIGYWVLKEACRQNKQWQDEGYPPISVAVNLSGRQFRQMWLPAIVASVLDETGLRPEYLELEVTEGSIMRNINTTVKLLEKLKNIGVTLAVDDFGTGYSSLNYLKRFPLDKLKIDRSFIQDIPANEEDAAITRAIIGMAHTLKMKVVAEGVETLEHLEFLRSNQCDEVQGFYIAKPKPAAEFVALLQAHSNNAL